MLLSWFTVAHHWKCYTVIVCTVLIPLWSQFLYQSCICVCTCYTNNILVNIVTVWLYVMRNVIKITDSSSDVHYTIHYVWAWTVLILYTSLSTLYCYKNLKPYILFEIIQCFDETNCIMMYINWFEPNSGLYTCL
jgi:hypothetical protein